MTAILFDLFETLVTESDPPPVRAASLGGRLGLDSTEFRRAWKPQRMRVVRGQASFAEALFEVGRALGRTLDAATVDGLCAERRREKATRFARPDPEALAALQRLHDRGIRLAVVSNAFAEDVGAWPQSAMAPLFAAAVFSCDVGMAKPQPEIYLEALRRLRVEAAESIFIGDGGDDELLGAERAGLRTAQATWFRREAPGLPARIPGLSSWKVLLEFVREGESPIAGGPVTS
jgi:HAD superfamily hydrolase (TIGR01509 family)